MILYGAIIAAGTVKWLFLQRSRRSLQRPLHCVVLEWMSLWWKGADGWHSGDTVVHETSSCDKFSVVSTVRWELGRNDNRWNAPASTYDLLNPLTLSVAGLSCYL